MCDVDEEQVHAKLREIVATLNSTRTKRLELEENRDLANEVYAPDVSGLKLLTSQMFDQ